MAMSTGKGTAASAVQTSSSAAGDGSPAATSRADSAPAASDAAVLTAPGTDAAPRPRLRDVAELAGVSVGTVSNVLNRPKAVSPEARERVERAIEDLHYVRNATASALRTGVSPLIGVAVLDIANPFFMEAAVGMEERLSHDGCVMLMSSTHANPRVETRLLRTLQAQSVRGILLTPTGHDLSVPRELARQGTRVVLFDSVATPPEVSSVAIDDTAGAQLAITHLLSLGHHRIAFLNGPSSVRQSGDRFVGVQRATDFAARARHSRPELIVHDVASYTAPAGRNGAIWLLDNVRPLPSAIFCANDLIAIGALSLLLERGIDVPGEVSIVGFDDIPMAEQIQVPLTTVRQPMAELGWTAADMLLSSSGVRHEKRLPMLIVRQSSGPAR
jgi:LacI family transcriptional regulator